MANLENGFQPVQDAISAQLVATTRTARELAAEDIGFLGSSDPKAKRKLDKQNKQLLELAQRLLSNANTSLADSSLEIKKPSQIDKNWSGVVDVIDSLLERADRSLDEFSGVIRRLSDEKEEGNESKTYNTREGKSRRTHPLSKPQLLFKHVPKNDETTSFRPLLTSKPHAIVPLDECLRPASVSSGREEYNHPYEKEIRESGYSDDVYRIAEPIPPIDDPAGKTLTWVDTPEQVSHMLEELKMVKEIAIDLEHHDQHSYVGLVSLMQISTREKDWIVDTLKPWRRDLQVLNEVFADPSILKVFHGSTSDMIWLQRDLGLYVVGLFDTYHATVALQYPRHGLAYLLKHFENFDAQKQYQMADWRTRPLTEEMMHYARADTHYLLHIYDCLRNELVAASTPAEDNKIDYVLERSKEEALQRYERGFYDFDNGSGSASSGWLGILLKTPAHFSKEQFGVFKAVHQFRDKVARFNDESLLSVMRNDTLFAIARTMPEEMPALMSCINPVSQFVQPKLSELLSTVQKAKRTAEDGPDLAEILDRPENKKLKKRFDRFKKPDGSSQLAGGAIVATTVSDVLERVKEALPVANGSKFWGAMLADAQSGETAIPAVVLPEMQGLRLSLPVTVSSSSDTAQQSIITPSQIESSTSIPASVPLTQPAEPVTFTIKSLRKGDLKRKAAEPISDRPTKQQAQESESDAETPGSAPQQDFELLDDGTGHTESLDSLHEARHSRRGRLNRASVKDVEATSLEQPDAETLAKVEPLKTMDKQHQKEAFKKDPALKQLWRNYKKWEKGVANAKKQHKYLINTAKRLSKEEGEGSAAARELLSLHAAGQEVPEELRLQIEASAFWGPNEPEADEPEKFDYTKATSVLTAAREISEKNKKKDKKDGKKKQKEFDPYSKALDTPKGLPRPKHGGGGGGRSMTFKK